MKLKTHFIIFISLFIINLFLCGIAAFDKSSSANTYTNYSIKRIVPDKVKFKFEEEEVLVIKTNKASGTTKLEINMHDYNGKLVNFELKAKVDPNNPGKLKYRYKDEDDDKLTFVSIKYPEIKKAQDTDTNPNNDNKAKDNVDASDKDSFKIYYRNKNGTDSLIAKVKFTPGKMKIGPDEELATPTYEIKNELERKKKKNVEKLKVYHKGVYIASVSQSKESGKYKVKKVLKDQEDKKDLYSTKDLNYMSYSVGVMGIEVMDPRLRAVIVAEILKKEK